MPTIAQQDYIRIVLLDDSGSFSGALCTEEIKRKMIELAKEGRISDVLLTSADGMFVCKILSYCLTPEGDSVSIAIYDGNLGWTDIELD